MNVTVTIPLRTYSKLNERHGWRKRARIAKAERLAGFMFCPRGLVPPMTVTLTRVGPQLLDDDAVPGALKSVRDGIADRIGINDRDPRVTWVYAQRRGKPKEYAVEISIQETGFSMTANAAAQAHSSAQRENVALEPLVGRQREKT